MPEILPECHGLKGVLVLGGSKPSLSIPMSTFNEALERQPCYEPATVIEPAAETCFLIYSRFLWPRPILSGTTGSSAKLIRTSQKSLSASAYTMVYAVQHYWLKSLGENTPKISECPTLLYTPTGFALFRMTFRMVASILFRLASLVAGATGVLVDSVDPNEWMKAIAKHKVATRMNTSQIQWLISFPVIPRTMLSEEALRKSADFSSLKVFEFPKLRILVLIIGGAAMPKSMLKRVHEHYPHIKVLGLGMRNIFATQFQRTDLPKSQARHRVTAWISSLVAVSIPSSRSR